MLREYLIQIYSQNNLFFDLLFISSNIILTASLGFILNFALQKIDQDWVTTFHHRMTFVLLPVITLIITTIISGNIALSLGMIGALSIVRFRNPVKNPFELVMYFALITLGITSSINFIYSIILTIFFVIIFYSFFKIEKYYREVKKKSLHKLSFSEGIKFNFIEVITTNKENILSKNEFIIDEFFDYQNSEYQYKFACPDRAKVQEVKLIIENLDKANLLSFNVRYN
jgi:hypothetical protein